MNERTKELAREAGLDDPIFPIDQWENPELKKYTELLIEEHLNILQQEWYRLNDLPKDDLDTPRDIGIRVGQKSEVIRLIHLIQQHFGLESVPKLAHMTNTDNPIDFPGEL